MAHGHDLPGLAVEFDADNTRKVLAEVVNRLAVGGGHHGHGLAHLVGLDRGTVVRRDGGGDFQRFGRGVVPASGAARSRHAPYITTRKRAFSTSRQIVAW